jgi:hypothetical protein
VRFSRPTLEQISGAFSEKGTIYMAEDRVAVLPLTATAPPNSAEWYIISAGKEFGPFSLAELIEKALVGKIGADDLVKQSGGLWAMARTFGFLRREFDIHASRALALEKLGQFNGLWLSKKALAIGGCLLLFLATSAVAWAFMKPVSPSPAPPKEQPVQQFLGNNVTDEERELLRWARKVKAATFKLPLAGIGKSFCVIPLVSAKVRDSFPEHRVKTRVETRLRNQGFSISPESPNRLAVQVEGVWIDPERKTTMGTNVSISLRDTVLATRPNAGCAFMDATIWTDAYVGVTGNLVLVSHIQDGIDRAVDRLIEEHLAANP